MLFVKNLLLLDYCSELRRRELQQQMWDGGVDLPSFAAGRWPGVNLPGLVNPDYPEMNSLEVLRWTMKQRRGSRPSRPHNQPR